MGNGTLAYRGMEQQAAHLVHVQKVAGSIPAPATRGSVGFTRKLQLLFMWTGRPRPNNPFRTVSLGPLKDNLQPIGGYTRAFRQEPPPGKAGNYRRGLTAGKDRHFIQTQGHFAHSNRLCGGPTHEEMEWHSPLKTFLT